MNKALVVFFFWIFIVLPLHAGETDFIEQIEHQFDDLESIYLEVEALSVSRDSEVQGKEVKEEWTFIYETPGLFAVDYKSDEVKRQIRCDYENVWEYLPEHHQVLKTSIGHLKPEDRQVLIGLAMSSVQIPFLMISDPVKTLKKREVRAVNDDLVLITGRTVFDGKSMGAEFYFDSESGLAERIDLSQKDVKVLSVSFTDYSDVNGYMFPRKIKYYINANGVRVDYSVLIKKAECNRGFSTKTYQALELQPDVEILERKGKKQ